mgnify:CR=1 FL=1
MIPSAVMGFLGGVRRLLARATSPEAKGGVGGTLKRGVLGLFRAEAPSVCPACDTPLPAALAQASDAPTPPRCPAFAISAASRVRVSTAVVTTRLVCANN